MTTETPKTCIGCGANPPQDIATGYTLISVHGWRIAREGIGIHGPRAVWRCPACWKVYKSEQAKRRLAG
jgi:hypothetical protein